MLRKYISLFLLVGFFNLFFFHQFGTVSFALLSSSVFSYIVFLFADNNTLKSHMFTIFGSAALLAVLNILLLNRAQGFVLVVLGLSVFLLLTMVLYLLSNKIRFVRSLLELILVPVSLLLNYIKSILNILNNILNGKLKMPSFFKNKSRIMPVISGFLVGIPIVLILMHLFSIADPIFKLYADRFFKLFNLRLSEQLVTRMFISVILLAVFTPLIYLQGKREIINPYALLNKFSLSKQMTVVMTMVALTVGAFLFVQWPYIFVQVPAETSLSTFGVATYSEYVKKGFVELIFIAMFIYSLVWGGLVILRNKIAESGKNFLFYIQLLVLTEFFVFLLSVFRRVYLYQLYHGLTLVRIYGTFFLIWIAGIGLLLALRHFYKKRFVYGEVGISLLLVFVFGLFNAEDYISKHNPPHVNKRTDFIYLSRMSADGSEGWNKAYKYAKETFDRTSTIDGEIGRDDRREIAYSGTVASSLLRNFHQLVYKYGTEAEIKEYKDKLIDATGLNDDNIDSYYAFILYPYNFDQPISKYGFYLEAVHLYKRADNLDKLYSWNKSEKDALKMMKEEIGVDGLFRLQKNYFDLYKRINQNQPGARDIDVDVSFDTPFL